ncbi:MAG TPA: hypothetical protein PKD00_06715 [Burkholderiales bacterium]|nr:hypothetical protein [Burkholderiales bacterium]
MFNNLFKNILFLNLILSIINSCGFKGPLYLAPKEQEKPKIKTSDKCIQEQKNIIESEPQTNKGALSG